MMKQFKLRTRARHLAMAILLVASHAPASRLKTRNVFLIISDGFRWQEVFAGAEQDLMPKDNEGLRAQFWRETPEARRQLLLPFFWSKIATSGQILGNRGKGSTVSVANGKKFSYPGYNEILTGSGDPRIDSNDKKPNPNVTVFEWLNGKKSLQGKVSVFGTWDDFPYIFNVERSHLPIWPSWEQQFQPFEITPSTCVAEMVRDTTSLWGNLAYDSFLFHSVMDHIGQHHPRLVFVGFGETDEWAHEGQYDHYLRAAHHVDDFVRRLWAATQAMSEYRDKTTFIITADHGRGSGPDGWRNHGEKIEGAEADWIAVLGPDTPPLGERQNLPVVSESQIAATIAALLGEDYHNAFPQSGIPIIDILGGKVAEAAGK